jgi:hypothetical protein
MTANDSNPEGANVIRHQEARFLHAHHAILSGIISGLVADLGGILAYLRIGRHKGAR